MVSVFVSTDREDLKHWKWKASANAIGFDYVGELKPFPLPNGESFSATVRELPMPSVVLSFDDQVACGIIKSIYDCDDEMEDCIGALREIVAICLPEVSNDEPISVFVHRGGNSYIEANPRLAETWKTLPKRMKRSFVCVAISRGGSGENVINYEWQKSTGPNKDNELELPSSEEEIMATLGKWCTKRCPEFLTTFGHTLSLPSVANGVLQDTVASEPSTFDSADSASSNINEMRMDDTSTLHVWIFADANSDGGLEKKSHEWIKKQRDCFKTVPCKQFEARVIPQLASGADRLGSVRDVYHGIARVLGAAIEDAPSTDRFVGVLDSRLYSNMGKGKDGMSSLQTVQGLLILAFPDVLWVPVFRGGDEAAKNDIKTALDLVAGGFNPIFDGTGIRGMLMRNHEPNSEYLYNRDDVAVTIDEECHFAELTAYTAFRFGYRAYPVSTGRLAGQVLNVDKKESLPSIANATVPKDATLIVVEDGFVEFPDLTQKENEKHLLGIGRDKQWRLLNDANLRILATASGPDELVAFNGRTENGVSGANERIKPNLTAKAWFDGEKKKDLNCVKGSVLHHWCEKLNRRVFNLFAGLMSCVFVVDFFKFVVIIGSLVGILFCCPIFLIPALFFLFVVFGWCRYVLSLTPVRHSRIWTFFKIRSQWRLYPKLYVNHVPREEIRPNETNFEQSAAESSVIDNVPQYWCLVRKPLGGIFGLRNQCGLPNGRGFEGQLDKDSVQKCYQNALKGLAPTRTGNSPESSNHSAYGMTSDLAVDLIGRARSLKNRGLGIEDAIHAAVLATCAYELLGHKTPALSIEALGLRHYCEVMAECEFPGVRARMDMEDRLIDIHNSMSQICRASNGDIREEMFESGMAAICDSLSELLRSRGRNEEAAFLSRQSRHMHRLLLSPFLRNLLAFPEWAVRGKLNFFTSLSIFLVVFALYYMFKIDSGADISDVLAKMYELLFSTQPNMDLTEIMIKANPTKDGPILKFLEMLGVIKLKSTQFLEDEIASATVVVQAMRQLALIHIGFLAALFYDFMHRK